MSETANPAQESQATGRFDDAQLYRELASSTGEHREDQKSAPRVTFEHVAQPDIPSEGPGLVAGILTRASAKGDDLQLSYAEAPTAHHYQLVQKFWGNELAVGLQQIKVGDHEFGVVSRYNIEPDGVFLQIVTDGDWDNPPARSVVQQTIANVGSYLLAHPHNRARQSTPHVTVSLGEGDHGSILKTYNLRQLELLREASEDEAA